MAPAHSEIRRMTLVEHPPSELPPAQQGVQKGRAQGRPFTSMLAWGALAVLMGLLSACSTRSPSQANETDPAYRLEVEQVRFAPRGPYPFDPLIGRAYVQAEKPIPVNGTWYPDADQTLVRIFEDGVERPVLKIHTWPQGSEKLTLMVVVPVSRGLAVGSGSSNAFHPALVKTLERLSQGYKDHFYQLAVLFCWGATERRYPFLSEANVDEFITDFRQLTYPGTPEGSYMDCMEGALADLDWLQRATPERAEAARLERGTFPLFFNGQQNGRTEVLLLTDGLPFREGPLDTFSDLLVRGNFPLHTIGVASTAEGERGLQRIEQLYERRKLAGSYHLIPGQEQLEGLVKGLVDGWLSPQKSFVIEYLSGFSGVRGTELPIWAAWRDGQFTSREIRATPGLYQTGLRWTLRALALLLVVGGLLFLLYRFRIWPFRESVQVVPCPEGCGHLIPDAWHECKFCRVREAWGRLVLLNGDRAGTIIYLKNDYYVLGSSPDADVLLTHLKEYQIQHTHATLHRLEEGEKLLLQFEGAPVTVGGKRLEQGSISLRFGDIISLGDGGISTILLRGVERTR